MFLNMFRLGFFGVPGSGGGGVGGGFKSTKYTEDSEFDISFPGSFNFSPKTRILEGTLVGIGHMANRVN